MKLLVRAVSVYHSRKWSGSKLSNSFFHKCINNEAVESFHWVCRKRNGFQSLKCHKFVSSYFDSNHFSLHKNGCVMGGGGMEWVVMCVPQ